MLRFFMIIYNATDIISVRAEVNNLFIVKTNYKYCCVLQLMVHISHNVLEVNIFNLVVH